MKATMESRQIRVFDRIERARSARSELIAAGCRPQDVRILDSRAAGLSRYLQGTPIPEAFAGLLMGGLVATILGVIPQISPLFERGGLPLYALIATGALVGAIGSYLIARSHPPLILDEDLSDGDYVVIADPPVERRAA